MAGQCDHLAFLPVLCGIAALGLVSQALLTQMSQTAACNRHHSVDQQLCRWFLLTLDRMPTNELVMTQELVASMLGSTCWQNSPQARAAIDGAIALARSQVGGVSTEQREATS